VLVLNVDVFCNVTAPVPPPSERDIPKAVFHISNALVVTGNPALMNLYAQKLDEVAMEMLVKALPAADEVGDAVVYMV